MTECMCVACHGPLVRGYRPARWCSINCKGIWYTVLRHGGVLPARYEDMRMLHAYRREMMAMSARLERMLDDAGLLMVGGVA